jgi:hypothetical protein
VERWGPADRIRQEDRHVLPREALQILVESEEYGMTIRLL